MMTSGNPASDRSIAGISLVETVVAAGVTGILFAALISSSLGIKKSMSATDQYVSQMTNGNRLSDAVTRDLRFAVKVGWLNGSTYTKLYRSDPMTVTETATLVITVPDYYASNAPNNGAGSSFKTGRNARSTLGTGTVAWSDAVSNPNTSNPTVRFAGSSAASDEMQIRYYRGRRSTTDSTVCYFRAEYAPGATTPSSVREIAEQIKDSASTTVLIVSDPDKSLGSNDTGKHFRVQSYFTPRYRLSGNPLTAASSQYVDVFLRNARRDIP